jgi:hypothetical protein
MGANHNGAPAAGGCPVNDIAGIVSEKLGVYFVHSSNQIADWLTKGRCCLAMWLFGNRTRCDSGAVWDMSQSARLSAIRML